MIYEQEVTLLVPYNPEETSEPSQWSWPDVCDQPGIEVLKAGPVTVVHADPMADEFEPLLKALVDDPADDRPPA